MKRAREFAVVFGRTEVDQESVEQVVSEAQQTSSWHKVWEIVENYCATRPEQSEALVLDGESKEVIARFSSQDLQVYASESGEEIYEEENAETPTRWDSEEFVLEGFEKPFFANRNILDYEWHLLDGATHDVPFRLSYLERKAELNPNGLVARCHRLMLEWRDMFAPNAVS